MTGSEQMILAIVAGQSPGYLIAPRSAAFEAEGFTESEAQTILTGLADQGLVELAGVYVNEGHGEQLVYVGWQITPAGKAAV